MKNRKNLGCRIKDPKERGAWAELYFMALAAGQGLKVSSPYGGFASYDVGVEDTGPILRVQVKCTMCKHPKGGYSLSIRGPRYRGYPKGSVDFFALYIIPTDDWYIIPYAVIGKRYATLHFTPDGARQKYGKYLEAWHLLLKATSRSDGPLDIRACCEEAEPKIGREAQAAGLQSVVRRMFRGLFQGSAKKPHFSKKTREMGHPGVY
ncbi:MAG: group I intron-associated PD-(D/E)XK endonuclease [Candidatus Sulfotelmatobacter sp.]